MQRSILIETTLDEKFCGEACEFMYGDRCNLFGAFLDHEGRQKIRCFRCKQSGALAKDIEDQWRKGVENHLKADFRLGEAVCIGETQNGLETAHRTAKNGF